jgi:hypothetical protein
MRAGALSLPVPALWVCGRALLMRAGAINACRCAVIARAGARRRLIESWCTWAFALCGCELIFEIFLRK